MLLEPSKHVSCESERLFQRFPSGLPETVTLARHLGKHVPGGCVSAPRWGHVSEEAFILVSFPFRPLRRHPTPNGEEINESRESTHKDHERR
jgi:hypothetical protein